LWSRLGQMARLYAKRDFSAGMIGLRRLQSDCVLPPSLPCCRAARALALFCVELRLALCNQPNANLCSIVRATLSRKSNPSGQKVPFSDSLRHDTNLSVC